MSMCVTSTPVEDHRTDLGLWVKREDLCCPGGPNFSKTRGVYAHVAARPERVIGVLDTAHSQGGWAVARACSLLGKRCVEFYPVRKADPGWLGAVQVECQRLGAETVPMPAGRSAVLYHLARAALTSNPAQPAGSTYMMPNALKLPEMVTETAAEVKRSVVWSWPPCLRDGGAPPVEASLHSLKEVHTILVSASSGTIAAGVCRGLLDVGWTGMVVVHQGYHRPQDAVRRYMAGMCGLEYRPGEGTSGIRVALVDEGYAYADAARPGGDPPFPCNPFYDLKLFRWWTARGRDQYGEALLWNIG